MAGTSDLVLTTTESVPGESIDEVIGMVMGNTVRGANIGQDAASSIKNIGGGELTKYSRTMTDGRNEALDRLEATADSADADAIISVRFQVTEIVSNATEVLAYGTAVTLE